MNELFITISGLLEQHGQSEILQDYFFNMAKSLFYANLLKNFFDSLQSGETISLDLHTESIEELKTKYATVLQDADKVLSDSFQKSNIDKKYYDDFKSNLGRDFPKFLKVISEIDSKIGLDESYFQKKREELRKLGKPKKDLNEIIKTSLFEIYVKKENRFPHSDDDVKKMMEFFISDLSKPLSYEITRNLKKDIPRMLKEQSDYQKGFESRLYHRWKEPIDLLESLIRISTEAGSEKRHKLAKSSKISEIKRSVLIEIHARALQISSEILTLVKSGYADGASARWRSLLELGTIAFFLSDKSDEILQRYVDHEIIRKYKESIDYQKYHKRLGEEPIEDEEFALLQKEKERLIQQYGIEFGEGDYGWIPKAILKDRTFKGLLESVKLDQLRPYYNLSTNATHGSVRGLHRLGLINNSQRKVLLAGASNYGFADPLQNTALSLLHVNSSLLLLEPDFENLLMMKVLSQYFHEIGEKAVQIQKEIEKEEKDLPDDAPLSGFIID